MAFRKDPKASTAMILEKLAEHPDGITSFELSKIMDINLTGRLSKLFDIDAVERTAIAPVGSGNPAFLYKPKAAAPSIAPLQPGSIAARNARRVTA